jgi:hypothetical protein
MIVMAIMENTINLTPSVNGYIQLFYVAQKNLDNVVREERLLKKIIRDKKGRAGVTSSKHL